MELRYIAKIRYLGAYVGTREDMEMESRTHIKAWDQGVRTLSKISSWYPHADYDGLVMLIQLEWKYLKGNFPKVGNLTVPIDTYLRENF